MSHAQPLLIEHGRLIDPSQGLDRVGRLLIIGGCVAAIDPLDGDLPLNLRRIEARSCIVAPGLVDLGTELREPGHEEDETIESGGAAALAGGYTTILCSANTEPPIDTAAGVELVRRIAAGFQGPRIHVIGCASRNRDGEQMAELGLLAQAGAVGFSDSPRPIHNSALLKRALDYCRMFHLPIFDRPVDPDLVEQGVAHDGQVALVLGLKGLPTEAEDLAVARDLRLAEATGGRLHVGPVSTMGGVDLLRRVKQRGIKVTASACPHNLWHSDEALRSFDTRFKVHPPLRSQRHIEAILGAVADGTIDAIQSGHMPRSREKKMDDIDVAPFGASTLETTLAVVATQLVKTNRMSWSDAIARLSTKPAEIAGLRAGTLQVGAAADVVIIDPDQQWTIDPEKFLSQCTSTPHAGDQVQAQVRMTIVDGEVRYQAEQVNLAPV